MPTELAGGKFVSQEHETSGTAKVIELADGSRILRLEGFSTSNGPDLHVSLSEKKAGGNWFKYGSDLKAQLGELKANRAATITRSRPTWNSTDCAPPAQAPASDPRRPGWR